MNRRALWFPALILLAACQGSEPTQPIRVPDAQPSALIVDGARAGGNPDFFWLWPMVAPPINHPKYDRGKSDGSHRPDLFICALNATTVAQVTDATPCKSGPGAYSVSYLGITPGFRFTSLDDDIGQYHNWWPTPNSNDIFYRIRAKVGTIELGYIDVHTVKTLLQTLGVDKSKFTPQIDGVPMLIRFRIELGALCFEEGACVGSGVVNLKSGGTVVAPDGDGVEIPPQPSGSNVTVTVTSCPDIPSDLPHKSGCVRVTTVPPLAAPLSVPAEVWVCDADAPTSGLSNQEKRYTMYRYDAPNTKALPHAHDDCPPEVVGDAGFSVRGMLADLGHGRLKSAGRQLAGILGPRPLYAKAFLDVGAGGFTDGFSDFQLMLPASMTRCSPWQEGQVTNLGTALAYNPTVCVTDVGGEPVAGATVHFATATGTLSAATVITSPTGTASVAWTPGLAGANAVVASGNGIGAAINNGPRGTVDPFQPLSTAFGDASNGPAVNVLSGSETFNASAVVGDPLPINYGSTGWKYQIDGTPPGGWQTTTVFGSTGPAPFGSANAGCALNTAGFNTAWPPAANTFLYARKTFAVTSPTQVQIAVAIDNDVQVFLDGADISSTNGQGAVPSTDPLPSLGLLLHENCPTQGSFTFITTLLPVGSHTVAFRARDRGTSSYFDARVTFYSP